MVTIIDGINRVLSPVCAFFSGVCAVMTFVVGPNPFAILIYGFTCGALAGLSWLAYDNTVRTK